MFKSNSSGVITVLVTLLLIPLLAFGTLIMEAGRYVAAKTLLAEAQATAAMSVLADFNVYLQDRFGLLAIDPEGAGESHSADYSAALLYNSNDEAIKKASVLYHLDEKNIGYSTIFSLADYNVIKKQILEYAKYSVPYEVVADKLNLENIFSTPFDGILGKIGDLTNMLNDMKDKTEKTVNELDTAFWNLGKVEFYNLDLQNYLGASKTKDDYNSKSLYDEYISKDDKELTPISSKGKPLTYKNDNYGVYYEAYRAAIEAKVTYMKNNPDPAPKKATADAEKKKFSNTTALSSTTKTKYLRYALVLDYMLSPEYVDEVELDVSVSNSVSYSAKGYTASISDSATGTVKYTSSTTTKKYTEDVDDAIDEIYDLITYPASTGYPKTLDGLEELLEDSGMLYSISSYGIESARDKFLNAVAADAAENAKYAAISDLCTDLAKEVEEYNKKIGELNAAINAAKTNYLTSLNNVISKLNTYHDRLSSAETELNRVKKTYEDSYTGAVDNYSSTSGTQTNAEAQKENDKNIEAVTKEMQSTLDALAKEKTAVSKAKTWLDGVYSSCSSKDASSITAYSLSNGEVKVNNGVVVAVTAATIRNKLTLDFAVIGKLCETSPIGESGGSINFKEIASGAADSLGISDLWDIFDKIKNVGTILNPAPAASDPEYKQTIGEKSRNLLPDLKDDGEDNPFAQQDEAYVSSIVDNVIKVLPDAMESGVGTLTIAQSAHNGAATTLEQLNEKITKIKESATNMKGKGLLAMAKAVLDVLSLLVETIELVVKAMGELFDTLKNLVTNFVNAAANSILINTYVTQKFPSRMHTVSEATVVPVGEVSPEHASYFNGACVEYVFAGSPNEETNQSTVYWIIFGIRAILNCIKIFMTSEVMSLISACNMFAPLAFLAFAYMETNIDMNYLVRMGASVPLWKTNMHLSAKGLMDILGSVFTLDGSGNPTDSTVWYTKSGKGERYHKSSCHTLNVSAENGNKVSTTLSEAIKKGLTACKVCKPTEKQENEDTNDKKKSVDMDYDMYLYLLLFFKGDKVKLQRTAELIQLETRYSQYKSGVTPVFTLSKANTYIRSEAKASYNTLLPMFSLGGNTNGFPSIYSLKYTGY